MARSLFEFPTRSLCALLCLALVTFWWGVARAAEPEPLAGKAERYFRGVYGCNPAVVRDLAAEEVIVSYPVFTELFGVPALRGRERIEEFAQGFCSRWGDAKVTVHDAVTEANRVVLVWSFEGTNRDSRQTAAWGGITLFQFDDDGRVKLEAGEESTPGPMARLGE